MEKKERREMHGEVQMSTEAVAFLLVKEGWFLAERRMKNKEAYPGMLAVPGGRMENGENREDTLFREMAEELNVRPIDYGYLISLEDPEVYDGLTVHYYVVSLWEGEPEPLEAAELEWLALEEAGRIEVPIDRQAVVMFAVLRESF
ncbi:MAG: NUDIX domain-containing protein [Candidatus Thermoplasmatota archaeon]|nr:NUDIX domain-containing protein [Candidatus Thermoplasmatota archaeon]